MANLVVEWTRDGGYDCGGFLTIACLQYESAEAFYVHLEEAVTRYLEADREHWKAYEIWNASVVQAREAFHNAQRRSKKRPCVIEEAQTKYNETYAKKPTDVSHELILGGITWNMDDFTYRTKEDDHRSRVFSAPDIKDLDQWFTEKCQELNP